MFSTDFFKRFSNPNFQTMTVVLCMVCFLATCWILSGVTGKKQVKK